MASAEPGKPGPGILGLLGVTIGVVCLGFAALGALNTLGGWKLILVFKGSRLGVADDWGLVLGLAATGVAFVALSLFGSRVIAMVKAAKGRPLDQLVLVVAALGLLFVIGRGVQVYLLNHHYGSMLAYYCTDGDLDDVRAELAKGPAPEVLSRSLSWAEEYDNIEALKLLLGAGIDYTGKGLPEGRKVHCGFTAARNSAEFIDVAVAAGASPQTCDQGEALIFEIVRQGGDDARVARRVAALIRGGWSPEVLPKDPGPSVDGGEVSTLSWARALDLKTTQAVLLVHRDVSTPATSAEAVEAPPSAVPSTAAAPGKATPSASAP